MKQYGISSLKSCATEIDKHLENIKRKGFTVLKNILSEQECLTFQKKMESIYKQQEITFGKENLEKISEVDAARMLFIYDDSFINLITQKQTLEIVKKILGNSFILQLQNGVINRNNKEHHQSSWHRDIPYQEYTTSEAISINVFFCLSPFNQKTGGTCILPYSHKFPKAPSIEYMQENMIQPEINTGDVIIFDSWLYHKAGYNSSSIIRYGVNHVFTTPILKQQINIPSMLQGKFKNAPLLSQILGYDFDIKHSVEEYRNHRLNKLVR